MQYLQLRVKSKIFMQQFCSVACIFYNSHNFDHLLCFQAISIIESLDQNSTLNSMVKPLQIALQDCKYLIAGK